MWKGRRSLIEAKQMDVTDVALKRFGGPHMIRQRVKGGDKSLWSFESGARASEWLPLLVEKNMSALMRKGIGTSPLFAQMLRFFVGI